MREGKFIYILIVVQIEIVHSTPSNSGGKKSASGRRLVIIPALPRIRWREILCINWPITSLSSEPVCLASAAPRRLSWLTARWCMPPSVSRAMGRSQWQKQYTAQDCPSRIVACWQIFLTDKALFFQQPFHSPEDILCLYARTRSRNTEVLSCWRC